MKELPQKGWSRTNLEPLNDSSEKSMRMEWLTLTGVLRTVVPNPPIVCGASFRIVHFKYCSVCCCRLCMPTLSHFVKAFQRQKQYLLCVGLAFRPRCISSTVLNKRKLRNNHKQTIWAHRVHYSQPNADLKLCTYVDTATTHGFHETRHGLLTKIWMLFLMNLTAVNIETKIQI